MQAFLTRNVPRWGSFVLNVRTVIYPSLSDVDPKVHTTNNGVVTLGEALTTPPFRGEPSY